MRRSLLILAALVVMAAGLAPAPRAFAQSSADALRNATALIGEKRAADALVILAPLAVSLKDDPEFETLYGLALIDIGKPREGAAALRRALATKPDNLIARAHLGRALAATGELTAARQEIAAVRDRVDLPAETRVVMDRNLETIDGAIARQKQADKQLQVAQVSNIGPRTSQSDLATIRTAAQLVRSKRAVEALAKLEPLAGRLAGNPDFDYVYGVAALEAGHPARASVALRRAVEARPGFHLARAELGRAYAAMGDLAGARREFELVRDADGLPALARDALGRQVIALDQALTQGPPATLRAQQTKTQAPPPRTRVSGYIENSLGYDTNVNAGPSSETLLIPALAGLGPASISPQNMPQKAAFYELAAGLSVSHAINEDTAVFANLVGNWHPLFDHNEFRTALAGGEAGVARQVGNLGIFSVAAIGQTFMMGDKAFRNIYGGAGQWRQRFADGWDAGLAVSWLGLEYPGMIGQNADRYSLIGTLSKKWEQMPLQPAFSLTGTAGREVARSDGMDFLTFTLLNARVGLETTWAPWLVAFVQAGYENHRHDADYPLFFVHRKDDLYQVLAGLEIKMTEQISLRPSVQYSQTRSNVDLFDQKRWISAMTMRWTF